MDKVNRPKRFYKDASVERADGGWAVLLDGRALKTPAKAGLVLPTEALAAAVAGEWQGQGEVLELQGMTLTRLANVAIDRTPETRTDLVFEVQRYGETDLTCFLAEHPSDLQDLQEAAWRPWRDWAGANRNVVLVPVTGLLASPQPAASLDAIGKYAHGLDDLRLTALAWGCSLYGSIVLSLAVEGGALDAVEAFSASCVDDDWQAAQWGVDEEARQVRLKRERDARAIGIWFQNLKRSS